MGIIKSGVIVGFTAIAVTLLPQLLRSPVPEDKVYGSCTEAFKGVENAYRLVNSCVSLHIYTDSQPGRQKDRQTHTCIHTNTHTCIHRHTHTDMHTHDASHIQP